MRRLPGYKDAIIRDGRDAAIDAFLRDGPPARSPYSRGTKSDAFWKHGAEQATAALEQLMRIGA